MKRTAKYTFWICTLLVLVGLTCRLLWQASRTETGQETLRLQWRDATWGLAVGNRTPIHSQEPATQARLWLDEIDRTVSRDGSDAELTIGAALVLDSPSQEYVSKYLKRIETIPGLGAFPELDEEGLKAAEDAFEAQCKERCLELAAKATEADPANVDWWRLRALLLWRYSMYSYDDSPRVDNWLEILQEASQHDPENALYDYLAAHFYWESSAEVDFQGETEQLAVKDAERFDRGVHHFEQGQKKTFFVVGDAGFSAVERFLSETAVPITDHEKIVNSRPIHMRRSLLLRGVWRWHGYRADAVAAEGDVRKALAMQRENLHLLNQFTGVGASAEYDNIAIARRVSTSYQMSTIVRKHKELFSAEVIEEIAVLEENARLTKTVVEQAARELAKNRPQRRTGITITGRPSTVLSALAVGIAPSLAIILTFVGVLAVGFSRIVSECELPKVGVIGHLFSFVAAFMCTALVFGLAPSKIVPPLIQAWMLTILVIVSPVAVVSWVVWTWLRRRAFRFSLRALLMVVFAFSVLFGIVAVARPNGESFAQLPFDLSIPALGWEGWDAKSLENVIRPDASWLWAALQWTAYYGQYLTVVVWAAIVAFLLHVKLRRYHARTGGVAPAFRNFLGAWIRSQGHACLTLSALVTILYLSFAPAVLAEADRHFQENIAFARKPSDHWSKVQRAVERVRADQELIDQLRGKAVTEIAEERSSESE